MDRRQKIDFLRRLQSGETTVKELVELPPLGILIKEGNSYWAKLRIFTEEELEETLRPYREANKHINGVPVLYTMLVI